MATRLGTTGLRICFRNNRIKKQIHQFWNNRIRNHFHEIGNNRIKNQIHRFGTTWLRFSWDLGTTGLRNKFTDFGTTGLRTIFTWGFGTRLRSTWPTRFGTTGLNIFERQRALSVLVKSSHCARGESEGRSFTSGKWRFLPSLNAAYNVSPQLIALVLLWDCGNNRTGGEVAIWSDNKTIATHVYINKCEKSCFLARRRRENFEYRVLLVKWRPPPGGVGGVARNKRKTLLSPGHKRKNSRMSQQ